MFDPNAPLPDFDTQAEQIARQQAMAEMLRKRAAGPAPQGQMVGRTYVKPHWTQYLVGLLNNAQAGMAEAQAAEQQQKYSQEVKDARLNWQASLPSIKPAVPGQPELPGPRAENGSPELDAVAPVPAELPSRDRVLKATLAGLSIPGNKDAAMLWNKGMGEEVAREDNQTAKREALQANLEAQAKESAAKLASQMEQARLRSEDVRLGIEQRREAAQLMADLKRQHDQVLLQLSRMTQDKKSEPKPLPSSQSKAWVENNSALRTIDQALQTIEANPKAFGLKNVLPEAMNQRLDPKGVEARAMVGNLGSLKIHDRSGAAVSAMEFPRLRPFVPDVRYDDAKTIKKKLELFAREYKNIQQEILDYADSQNYKSPGSIYERAPVDATTPASGGEETRVLNGKKYVKRNGQWYEQ